MNVPIAKGKKFTPKVHHHGAAPNP